MNAEEEETLIKAAQAYRKAGATEIYAVCSHGVFPKNAWEKIKQSGLFTHLIATDSHPKAHELQTKGLELISASSIFATALQKIFN